MSQRKRLRPNRRFQPHRRFRGKLPTPPEALQRVTEMADRYIELGFGEK